MKKSLFLCAFCAALVLGGCAEKNPAQTRADALNEKIADLPKWAIEDAGFDAAIGSAPATSQTYVMQLNEATAVAKMNLAQKIASKVTAMSKTYYERTGGASKDNYASVSKQVASAAIEDARVEQVYVAKDGELIVLVRARATNLIEAIRTDNKAALFEELSRYE